MRKKRIHKAGFTLIEMLVVLAIMGMILAISVPAFDSVLKNTKVSEGTKLIYKTLEFARQHAVTHGVDTTVEFDTVPSMGGRTGYRVFVEGEGDIEDWSFLFSGVSVDTSSMPDGEGTAKQVRFTSAGTPSSAGSIRVEDSNNTVLRRITYSNISGHIRLFDLEDN